MKKLGKLARILTIVLCLVGITNVSAEYKYKFDNKKIETAVLKQVKKSDDKVKEEEKKKEKEQQAQVQRTQQPVYTEQITGNSITISGTLSKPLMKDYDGSNFYLNHDIKSRPQWTGFLVCFKDYQKSILTPVEFLGGCSRNVEPC